MGNEGHRRLSAASVALIGATAGAATLLALAGLAGAHSEVVWDLAWTLGALSALAGSWLAWRAAPPTLRRRWLFLTVALGAWVLAQLAWNVEDIVGQPGSPSGSDILWLIFSTLAMLSLVRYPGSAGRFVAMLAVESLPLVASAVGLSFGMLWHDVAHTKLPTPAMVTALGYRGVNVALVVISLQAVIGGELRKVRTPGMLLVITGVLIQAICFSVWSEVQLDRILLPDQSLLDSGWVLGLAAIGIGGLLSARRPEDIEVSRTLSPRGAIMPGGLFLFNLAALVWAHLNVVPAASTELLELGLMFSGGALILRSHLLERRMRGLLERERRTLRDLAEREAQLAKLNERLMEDSRRDPLTGLRNRRALSEDLPLMEEIHSRHGGAFAFALCDIDHFKDYNDRMGHLAGDQALRALSQRVSGALRAEDAAYRFGGEELLLVLRSGSTGEALRAAERVRTAVEAAAFSHPGGIGGVLTLSVGVAAGDAHPEDLLARADGALYEAKRQGRNRVVIADGSVPMPAPERRREHHSEGAVPRHLRGLLAISRAAAAGAGREPVLEALAETIRSELSFGIVVCNLIDPVTQDMRVALVSGHPDAREKLLGTTSSWAEWEQVLKPEYERCGAYWLPAGTYNWAENMVSWVPPSVPSPSSDAWQPDDALMLPLRGAGGELLGIVSVDQPLLGRRPGDDELTVLVAVVDHAALALEQAQRDSATSSEQSQELRLAAVMLLAETLDLRDAGTARHSRLVGRFARDTAAELRLEPARVERIHAAGVLHDLGKLGIADKILHKAGSLDDYEWREMQRHPEIGARILEHAGMHDIAVWVRAHHERLDGRGYPLALPPERIPLEARILAVADAYEAMVADRPYRAGRPAAEAQAELRRCAGTQFDPVVVEAFLRICHIAEVEPVPPAASEGGASAWGRSTLSV